jgi:O-methyltransferase involved in polyketide biosynthesis
VFRLDSPAGVLWFGVDVPAVIELRRQVYQEHDRYRMIGPSVTAPGWLDAIPTDRPVLVIAEGLFPYLTEGEVRQLLQRLTDHLGRGRITV